MSMPICTTVQLYILLLGNEFVVQTYISTVSQKLKLTYYLSDFNNGIKYCSSKYIFNCTSLNVTVLKIDRNFNPVASIKYQSDWDVDL
jgi:hypothetical protein